MTSCATQLRELLDGRLTNWRGLPPDCSLSAIAKAFGGVSMLDASARLGSKSVSCTRSSAEEAPLTLWHSGETILLAECDLLSTPVPMPSFDPAGIFRMDVEWGAATLKGGEMLTAARGLSLIVTDDANVVTCFGFSPMSAQDYLATRRLRGQRLTPLIPHPIDGAAR
ncbi:MAG: hypothetical protein AAAB35_11825 [Phyllobacterium sp.]|uniref:hypothetical protein n=1 Tax=Phyllobacterium sp. TaxID=1871046 RepID=UPI0030F0D402